MISPLAVIARRHAVRNGNFTEELSKYQDEVMTSYDDPKEGKLYCAVAAFKLQPPIT